MRELAHNHRPERTWNWTRENYCVHAEIPPLLSDNKLQEEKKTTNCYSISESTHTHQLQRWTGKMQDFLFQFFVCFFNEEKWRKKTKRRKKICCCTCGNMLNYLNIICTFCNVFYQERKKKTPQNQQHCIESWNASKMYGFSLLKSNAVDSAALWNCSEINLRGCMGSVGHFAAIYGMRWTLKSSTIISL